MPIQCSSYDNDAEAHAEVARLLADGTPGAHISVLTGQAVTDHRADAVGAYAGAAGPVGAFAGAAGSSADAMGDFAGSGAQRRGSFADADRDIVATYPDGVRREHVASHRELERRLTGAGLDADGGRGRRRRAARRARARGGRAGVTGCTGVRCADRFGPG